MSKYKADNLTIGKNGKAYYGKGTNGGMAPQPKTPNENIKEVNIESAAIKKKVSKLKIERAVGFVPGSLKGWIEASFYDLRQALGEPDPTGDPEKVPYEWGVTLKSGRATIYPWHPPSLIPEGAYVWNVGGEKDLTDDIVEALSNKGINVSRVYKFR